MSSNRLVGLALLLLMTLTGCFGASQPTALGTGLQSDGTPPVANPGQILNPQVIPPPKIIVVAPDLVADESPPGSLTAAEAKEKALSLMQSGSRTGLLRLTALRWDDPNQTWEAEFATPDGRLATAPRSHPAPIPTGDQVLDRKQMHSWYTVTEAVFLTLDGTSGEVRGGGYRGGSVQPDRPDLEHYVGRIISGGEETRLQLTNPDGSPAGRELTVVLPDTLFSGGLALWQVWYGTGRELEVWGLTGGEGVVVAHKIAMASPPPENLLANALVRAFPLCPECHLESSPEAQVRFVTTDSSPERLQAWYRNLLPEYGWKPTRVPDQFASAAGPTWDLRVTAYSGGTAVTLTRVDSTIPAGD